MILAYLIPLAVLIGFVRGGSFKGYADSPLRAIWLPIAAFLVEALMGYLKHLTGWPSETCLLTTVPLEYALLILFCALNIRRTGMKLMLVGILMNLAVIAANGLRMPVSELVLHLPSTQATARRIQSGELFEYVIVRPDAPLYLLGDVIYLPLLPGALGSAGDWVMGAGVVTLILNLMKRPRKAQ